MIANVRASVVVPLLLLGLASASADAATRPRVRLLATGGTIAAVAGKDGRYTAGQLSVEALTAGLPELAAIAEVSGEQVVNIASQDATDEVWLKLRARVLAAFADATLNGVVITHGTDTLEETALFLDRTLADDRPVVITGAMRTPTAPGADGPANLVAAVKVASDPAARGRGCLVVMNDTILGASGVTKRHVSAVHTFGAPNSGPVGEMVKGEPVFFAPPAPRPTPIFDLAGRTRLPSVAILYAHADLGAELFDAAITAGADGIVLAGVGNGNASQPALAALDRARRKGVVVVRSSRIPAGHVSRNVEIDDDARGFVAAGAFSPQQARVLLLLGLTRGRDPVEIQKLFNP